MKNIAIFASGSGTNADRVIDHFKGSAEARVALVLSNKADAGVLGRAATAGVKSVVFSRGDLCDNGRVVDMLREYRIDFIVLAGFLWLVPAAITKEWHGRIVNIHPALLPKYGGKGMYGDRVHKAVIENGEKESGITIHLVNEIYDNGDILEQHSVPVAPDDTPESLAAKIHALEYEHFPAAIERRLKKVFCDTSGIAE